MRAGTRRVLQGIVVLLLMGVVYLLAFDGSRVELADARAQRQKLLERYRELSRVAINLDVYRQQRRELDDAFGGLLDRLPIKGVTGDREQEVRQAIRDASVAAGVSTPVVSTGPESVGEALAYRRLDVLVTGGFRGLVQFAQEVSTASLENWTVQYASLKPDPSGRGLRLLLELRVYRPLQEEELEAARKAAKGRRE